MRTWRDSSLEPAGPRAPLRSRVKCSPEDSLSAPTPWATLRTASAPTLLPPSSGGPSACSRRGLYTFSDFLLTSAQQRQLGDSGPRCWAPSSMRSLFAQAFGSGPLA